MRDKSFRNIFWLGLAAVMVFAPLAHGAVQLSALAPIELVVLILVFLWLVRANSKREQLCKTKIDFPLWLFVILAIVSCFFSIYKYASVAAILRLLMYLGVFYLVVNKFNRYLAYRLVSLIIIVAALMSLLGLGQYFLGLKHSWWKPQEFLAATYVNHNHFAGYLELAIPLAIGMVLAQKQAKLRSNQGNKILIKVGLVVALIIMFIAFVFSQSRGAWASLAISLVVMNIVLVRKKVLKKESLLVFLLLLILGIVYIYSGYDAVARRLGSVEEINQESFFEGRLKIWQGSTRMIGDNPLYGSGIGTFVWGFPPYRPQTLQIRAHYAHNDYLQMMAEMGVLALPLMLWMIWVVVAAGFSWQDKEGLKKKRRLGLTEGVVLGSAVGILSLSLHGLIDFNFHIPANMLVVACLAGIIMRRAQ